MADAGGLRGVGQFGGREAIDPVIGLLGDVRAGMRDAGEMHHRLDTLEQRAPFDRPGQVGDRHHLDRSRGNTSAGCRIAARTEWPGFGKLGDQRAADEARCAGDEDARHDLPRAKLPEQPADQCSAASKCHRTELNGPGHSTLAAGQRDQRQIDGKHAGDDLRKR